MVVSRQISAHETSFLKGPTLSTQCERHHWHPNLPRDEAADCVRDGFNDGGHQPSGRQMLTCEESAQNQDKTNGRHSTNDRSHGHVQVVVAHQHDVRWIWEEKRDVGANLSLEALTTSEPKTWKACFCWNFQQTNAISASSLSQAPQNKRNDRLRNRILQRRATEPSVLKCFLGSIDHKRAQNLEGLLLLEFPTNKCNLGQFFESGAPKQTQRSSPQSNSAKESNRAKCFQMFPWKH
jgi:hypothetical protein